MQQIQYTQLKSSDIPKIREQIAKEQNNKCAICTEPLEENSGISLDHQHKINRSQEIGDDGAGLIRGVLCRNCNVYEGKIWNNSNRYSRGKTVSDRIKFLKQLIEYYEKPNYDLIHPSEKPKEKTVSKSNYNKLKKLYTESKLKARFPEYPKSKKLTIKLKTLFELFEIEPYN